MKKLKALEEKMRELVDLGRALAVLSWDQEVNMPPMGVEARAQQLATLSRLLHERLTAEETGRLIEEARSELNGSEPHSYEASLVRAAWRDFERQRKVPASLVATLSETSSHAHQSWARAREEGDFALFQPWLERLLDLARQRAEHLGYQDQPYDALIEDFEPGMTTAEVAAVLDGLRRELVPLVAAIRQAGDVVDDSLLQGDFPIEQQRAFCLEVSRAIGFDYQRGRLDVAVHPFASGMGVGDVRLTTRYNPNLAVSALFSTIHESGHGMYEQGFAPELGGTVLAEAASMAVHESQSRLWENQLGRSREFWQYYLPRLQGAFPGRLDGVTLEQFYRAINKVSPGFIRVDADEVTYNLHIMLRFEIEVGLFAGKISVEELPAAWDDRLEAYLGIRPRNASEGVLQDIHWSAGMFGYFPSYSLGTIMAAQLYAAMLADHPDFPQKVARGEFGDLLAWMREHVHRHGRRYWPQELLERATGSRLSIGPYMEYIRRKYGEIYRL